MPSEWFSCPLLQCRESVKRLLIRNEEVLSASAKEAGCSTQQLRLAMEKHLVMTEKERETMTAEEAGLFMLLRAEGPCRCSGTCSGECSGNGNCGREN